MRPPAAGTFFAWLQDGASSDELAALGRPSRAVITIIGRVFVGPTAHRRPGWRGLSYVRDARALIVAWQGSSAAGPLRRRVRGQREIQIGHSPALCVASTTSTHRPARVRDRVAGPVVFLVSPIRRATAPPMSANGSRATPAVGKGNNLL